MTYFWLCIGCRGSPSTDTLDDMSKVALAK